MNQDIEYMMKIYDTYKYDWMGDEIKNPSNLTRHHIIKREKGGKDVISNYALLTDNSHQLIHYLEIKDHNSYINLNELFLELNRSNMPPTSEYEDEVKRIIKKVKKDIKNSKRKRKK